MQLRLNSPPAPPPTAAAAAPPRLPTRRRPRRSLPYPPPHIPRRSAAHGRVNAAARATYRPAGHRRQSHARRCMRRGDIDLDKPNGCRYNATALSLRCITNIRRGRRGRAGHFRRRRARRAAAAMVGENGVELLDKQRDSAMVFGEKRLPILSLRTYYLSLIGFFESHVQQSNFILYLTASHTHTSHCRYTFIQRSQLAAAAVSSCSCRHCPWRRL